MQTIHITSLLGIASLAILTGMMPSAILADGYGGSSGSTSGSGATSTGGTTGMSGGNTTISINNSLKVSLTDPAIGGTTPQGQAEWNLMPDRDREQLIVMVQNVNLPDGTVLAVSGCGSSRISNIYLKDKKGNLTMDESSGDRVPTCEVNEEIFVMNGDTLILSGKFAGVLGASTSDTATSTGTTGTTQANRAAIFDSVKSVLGKLIDIVRSLNGIVASLPR